MASGIYNVLKGNLMKKQVNLDNGGDTLKVALYDENFSFVATGTVYASTNELATANGYTRDSKTLSGQAVTAGATTKFDADDVSWSNASFTARYAVIYDVTNSNSLICCFDFGENKTVNAGTFTLAFNASGIITLA